MSTPRLEDLSVIFGELCIACEEPARGETWRFSRRRTSFWSFALPFIGRKHTVEVPACPECRSRMRRKRFLSDWSWILLALALAFILLPRTEILRPPPFEMTVWGKNVDYEFADPDQAEAFYELNKDQGAQMDE